MTTTVLADWSRAIKARDGRCLDCGSVHDLHAHHVLPKASHPELTLDLENGRTLCYRCHKRTHEAARPHRIRAGTGKLQRRTLERQIETLKRVIATLEDEIATCDEPWQAEIRRVRADNRKLHSLVLECERGVCSASIKRKRVLDSITA